MPEWKIGNITNALQMEILKSILKSGISHTGITVLSKIEKTIKGHTIHSNYKPESGEKRSCILACIKAIMHSQPAPYSVLLGTEVLTTDILPIF
jgi:hypothetical protein